MSEFGNAFDKCQAQYDSIVPEESWNCEEDGHRWKKTRVAHINGEDITEIKCRICGKVEIV